MGFHSINLPLFFWTPFAHFGTSVGLLRSHVAPSFPHPCPDCATISEKLFKRPSYFCHTNFFDFNKTSIMSWTCLDRIKIQRLRWLGHIVRVEENFFKPLRGEEYTQPRHRGSCHILSVRGPHPLNSLPRFEDSCPLRKYGGINSA